jgi:hypothetical protein
MNQKLFFNKRLIFTTIVSLTIWSLLLFEHFNGGVPSHHILNRKDLPEISNWWGGLLLPILTWFLLLRTTQRLIKNKEVNLSKPVIGGFLIAFFFGVSISTSFSFNIPKIPEMMLQSILFIALFFPIYRAECLIGFVLGMTYTFGTVLPTGIGSVLAVIGAILYLLIRPVFLFMYSRVSQKSKK